MGTRQLEIPRIPHGLCALRGVSTRRIELPFFPCLPVRAQFDCARHRICGVLWLGMTNLFFEITTAERPERRLSHGLIHPVTPFPAEEDPSRIHLAKKRMELELGRQHTLILAHLGHQAKAVGSHHGPAGGKKRQDLVRWGLLSTEVSRHGGLPRALCRRGGGRRKSKNVSRLRLFPEGPPIQSSVLPDGKLSLLTGDHVIAI